MRLSLVGIVIPHIGAVAAHAASQHVVDAVNVQLVGQVRSAVLRECAFDVLVAGELAVEEGCAREFVGAIHLKLVAYLKGASQLLDPVVVNVAIKRVDKPTADLGCSAVGNVRVPSIQRHRAVPVRRVKPVARAGVDPVHCCGRRIAGEESHER